MKKLRRAWQKERNTQPERNGGAGAYDAVDDIAGDLAGGDAGLHTKRRWMQRLYY